MVMRLGVTPTCLTKTVGQLPGANQMSICVKWASINRANGERVQGIVFEDGQHASLARDPMEFAQPVGMFFVRNMVKYACGKSHIKAVVVGGDAIVFDLQPPRDIREALFRYVQASL